MYGQTVITQLSLGARETRSEAGTYLTDRAKPPVLRPPLTGLDRLTTGLALSTRPYVFHPVVTRIAVQLLQLSDLMFKGSNREKMRKKFQQGDR